MNQNKKILLDKLSKSRVRPKKIKTPNVEAIIKKKKKLKRQKQKKKKTA